MIFSTEIKNKTLKDLADLVASNNKIHKELVQKLTLL